MYKQNKIFTFDKSPQHNTDIKRLNKIIKDSHQMNYFISMLSTTGGKLKVSPKQILKNYKKIKRINPKKKVVIGFGITEKTIGKLKSADGLVVGSAICNEITRSQVHPVTDNRNQTIAQPTAQDINTSIQRCLAKAIALHGLGLYIFAGEDLPEPDALNSKQRGELLGVVKKLKNKSLESDILRKMDNLQINVRNYEASIEKLNEMIKDKGDK